MRLSVIRNTVKKIICVRMNIFGYYIYICNKRMKIGQQRDCVPNYIAFAKYKRPYLESVGYRCECCGKVDKHNQVHHVLRYANFEELRNDTRNYMCVCRDCHARIHHNPLVESRLAIERALVLGYDIEQIYR